MGGEVNEASQLASQPVKPASQPVGDQPEGRRSAATQLVPHSIHTEALETYPPPSFESGGSKGMGVPAGLVPAGSLLTSYYPMAGRQLAGWLTGCEMK